MMWRDVVDGDLQDLVRSTQRTLDGLGEQLQVLHISAGGGGGGDDAKARQVSGNRWLLSLRGTVCMHACAPWDTVGQLSVEV